MREIFKNITDLIYASLLFLLTTFLGIGITFGASLTALQRVCFQVFFTKEPNPVTKVYFKSFKESFLQSTIFFLILAIVGVSLFMAWNYSINQGITWLMLVLILSAYEWLIFFIYGFSMISLFKTKNIKTFIVNILVMGHTNIWLNIKLIGTAAFVFFLCMYINVAILIAPMIYGYLIAFHLIKPFNKFIEEFKPSEQEDLFESIKW